MSASPNWLIILGLVYAGVGIALVAGATLLTSGVMSTGERARARFARLLGNMAMTGAALALMGFIMQAAAQFHAMPLNGYVALGIALLMAGLVWLAFSSPIGFWGEDEVARSATVQPVGAPMGATVRPLPNAVAGERIETAAGASAAPAVKLVSTG